MSRALSRSALVLAAVLALLACRGGGDAETTRTKLPMSWPVPVNDVDELLIRGGDVYMVESRLAQPSLLSRIGPDGGVPDLVGTDADYIRHVAVDGDEAFWIAKAQRILVAPAKGGKPARVLVTEPGPIWQATPSATHVYYQRRNGGVMRVPRAGGPAEQFLKEQGNLIGLDGDKLYFHDAGVLQVASTLDASITKLAADFRPWSSAVLASDAVFAIERPVENGPCRLVAAPRVGGPVKVLIDDLDEGSTFAVTTRKIVLLSRSRGDGASEHPSVLYLVDRASGTVDKKSPWQENPRRISADDSFVYFVDRADKGAKKWSGEVALYREALP